LDAVARHSHALKVSVGLSDTSRLPGVLASLGLTPAAFASRNSDLVVTLDGKVSPQLSSLSEMLYATSNWFPSSLINAEALFLYSLLPQVLGFMPVDIIVDACAHIRILKSKPDSGVPPTLEVALVPPTERGQFPGLFLFSTPSRLIRPVRNLRTNAQEYIGSFEQVGRSWVGTVFFFCFRYGGASITHTLSLCLSLSLSLSLSLFISLSLYLSLER
jgi:DNA-directed RNA polymerase I subunit RPA2